MAIDITLANDDTDGFFNTLRDAVRERDLDTLSGLRDIISLAAEMGQVHGTEKVCFEAHVSLAELHVKLQPAEDA
ncbi:MAG: hypothetical protein K0U66_07455 [Gammaproteobacteria bacterium]|nr:hypothetical protein [Gammaproteobacteria bacterium]